LEGQRVRQAYARASQTYGVEWHGRRYDRSNWGGADPPNRALSLANALLNGLCHAAIVSGGYSPALGFIHTGKQRSFVYDIADLYKVEVTIPLAFHTVAESNDRLYHRVRQAARDAFKDHRLLKRILPDIKNLLDLSAEVLRAGEEADSDPARPEPWWTPPDQTAQAVTLTGDADSEARQRRRHRAREGLRTDWIVSQRASGVWTVVTRPDSSGYTIRQVEGTWECDCPDYARNGLGMCKHTTAVEMTLAARASEGGA
jgi:hypothetical protein